MLSKFNKAFSIPEGTPLKRLELEDALIVAYGDLQYKRCRYYDRNFFEYSLGCDFELGCNNVHSEYRKEYMSTEEALMGFFLDNRRKKAVKQVIKEVYKVN